MTDTEKELQNIPLLADNSDGEDSDRFASNYAMAIALGLPMGMLFGLLVLDNIAWGLLIGAGLAPIIAIIMSNRKPSA